MPTLFQVAIVCLTPYFLIRFTCKGLATGLGSRHGAYRKIAAKYRGRCESRGLVDPPTVTFSHQGASVRVGLAPIVPGQPPQPRTRVVIRFARGIPFRLELFPQQRQAPAQQPRGTRPVAVGHAEFDRIYLVHANDPDIARSVFAPHAIRASIETLRQICPPAGILLSINPERVLLQLDRNLGSSLSALDLMVRSGLLVHDWILTSVLEQLHRGIEVVEVGRADPRVGPAVCEVCGDPILGPHVACSACHTPFHRDCWTFIGACSTFGCQSRNQVEVRG